MKRVLVLGVLAITMGVLGGLAALTVEQALDTNGNRLIDDLEMLQALNLWTRQAPVPGTDGSLIDDLKIVQLLQLWIKQTPLGEPPPPPPAAKACPEAAPTARVLTVPAQFPTIQQAIQNARDGDTILVLPGSYPGGILVDKGVIIESQGGPAVTTIRGTPEQSTLRVLKAVGAVVRGFTISNGRAGVSLGDVTRFCMEQNEIVRNFGPGIEIAGKTVEQGREAQDVTIINNLIRGNVGFGIVGSELLRAKILSNEIIDTASKPDGTAGRGISLTGVSRVEVRQNTIFDSHGHGIFASGVTDLEITENEIRNAPLASEGAIPAAGIAIGSGTIGALVVGNAINENDIGILIDRARGITVRSNTITGSKVAGVSIANSLLVRVEGDTITDTQPREPVGERLAIGIEVRGTSTVTMVGVTIRRSFGYGLFVVDKAEVEVSGSTIEETTGNPGVAGHGVGVEGASLFLTESLIARNRDSGIAVLRDGRAELSDNTIRENGDFGIFADPQGAVSCPATNIVLGNGRARSENVPAACGG
jgi:nitrous oxidase accessory protein NosD